MPDEVLSYRQNLTALVEHGEFNPWKREWWGGTPKGWKDNIHTTRTGICLTKEGFLGYFYGVDLGADILAGAMLVARCQYGVHLDMNPGLAGFEFYDVEPAADMEAPRSQSSRKTGNSRAHRRFPSSISARAA